jgi:hypothetical protein
MTRRGATHESCLTAYEEEQVRGISLWKSTPPNPLSELWKLAVVPVAQLVERVVPDRAVLLAVERTYDAAALLAGQQDIQNGKIARPVAPADVPERMLAAGWRGATGRAVYGGFYFAGFGVALPI